MTTTDDNDLLMAGKLPPIDDPAADAEPVAATVEAPKYNLPAWVADRDFTDIGNGRLMAMKAGELRFAPSLGWLHYEHGVWLSDEGEVKTTRIATDILDTKFTEAAAHFVAANKLPTAAERNQAVADAEREMNWYSASRRDKKRLTAMLAIGATVEGVTVDAKALDRHPLLLSVENGVVDLKTGKLRAHDPLNLLTKQMPVTFDPKAVATNWDRYLKQVFKDDAELIDFVRRWLGYCLTGSMKEQKFVLFNGLGANGKSLLFRVLVALFGSYAAQIEVETTLIARPSGGSPRPDILKLRGVRLGYASEFADGNKLAVRFVKSATGGEQMVARGVYAKSAVEFEQTAKLTIATNILPEVSGSDRALWRRLRVVPFTQTFSGANDDRELFDKLAAELPGILNWCIAGCLAWQQSRLGEAGAVSEAGDEYRLEQDIVGRFIEERCEVGPDAISFRHHVLAEFLAWCSEENEPRWTGSRFARELRLHSIKAGGKRGVPGEKSSRHIWIGLRLRSMARRMQPSPVEQVA